MRPFISSMATTTSPLPSSSSSSLCNNKVSTFSLTHSTTTSLIQAHFPPQHHLFKPFKLKIHISTFSPLFSLHSIPHFCTPSVGFNGSEAAQEEEEEEEEEDPEVELHDNQNIEEEEKEDERRGSGSGEQGRLYVGNLPYSMTSSQLSEVFGEAGRVVSVEVVYDRVTDRSRGFAFVTMESVEEAKEAIRMFNGSLVGGRTVKVNFPEVPRGGEREVMGPTIRTDYKRFIDSPHKIYAGNLSWGLTSQILTDAFAELPGLLSAKVIYDRSSGRCKGYGFISFETAEDAESALNSMNGVEVEGRPLRLNMASERAQLASPAELERTENSLDSSEVLSSISM